MTRTFDTPLPIDDVLDALASTLQKSNTAVLVAPPGAGKTTLVHALCEAKGVKDVVGSPTFAIINEYAFNEGGTEAGKIFHIDLYRLQDEEDAIRAGVEDCLYSDHICLVEWPERAPGIFPDNTAHIYINVVNSSTRRLRIDRN